MIKYDLEPYFINSTWRAIVDNGLTPYITLVVDDRCNVPQEHIKEKNGLPTITFNTSLVATPNIVMNDKEEYITFSGAFSGRRIDVQFTYDNIVAIYARELKDFGIVVPYTPPKQVEQEQEQEPERAKPVLQVVK